jgi:plasmid stability protein
MKSLLIRNIPDRTLAVLKKRAKENHRSLQGELHALLSQATRGHGEIHGPFKLKTVRTSGLQNWSREAIYED